MRELAREQARAEAELAATIAEFVDLRRREPVEAVAAEQGRVLAGEFAADEVAAALGCSTRRVQSQARLWRRLRSDLPQTAALWRDGAIDGYKAGKVVDAADRLTRPESIAALDDGAAHRASSQAPSQLGQWLNRRVARLEPDRAERRHRRAHADRQVSKSMDLDGMGSLWMMAGAADIAAIDSRLTDLARGLGADDPRTMDQRRTDLAIDLLLSHHPGGDEPGSGGGGDSDGTAGKHTGAAPAVAITVPIQSLLGVDDTPGELTDRSASIPAPLAREIAARPDTLFYRLLTDDRGHLLDVTELGRFPSTLLGFAIDIRDGTCRWTTCNTPAAKCDHDHTVPAPDGPTAAANLGPPCRRHHRAKTHAGFDLTQPEAGMFVWTTPTGHRYFVEPEPLPVGTWPRPAIADEHTPITQLIDLDDRDPPTYESDIRDALGPRAGPEPLLRSEFNAIVDGLEQ